MTTGGEGGMVTCNDEALWRKMWSYKDHGKSYEAVYERDHAPGFRWLHESFGTNWRMLEMQAVIGRIQLRQMQEWTSKRSENAMAIQEAFRPFSGVDGLVRIPELYCSGVCEQCSCKHAFYKYYVYVKPDRLPADWSRDRIIEQINTRGVPCYSGSCSEIYLEKAFDGTDFRPKERLPNAKKLGETSLMFLVHPTLTDEDIRKTQEVIAEVFGKIIHSK